MGAHDLLRETLQRSFSDGTRHAVLFVGAGLHNHLQGHHVPPPEQAPANLANWNGLLEAARLSEGREEFPATAHIDATATWESMLASRCELLPTKLASEHEDVLLRRVRTIIQHSTPQRANRSSLGPARLERFGRALRHARYRDLITLNFDRTLDESMKVPGNYTAHVASVTASGVRRSAYRSHLHVKFPNARIWHAHGMAYGARAESIQLGIVAYANATAEVSTLVQRYRARQQAWRRAQHGGAPPKIWDAEDVHAWHTHTRRLDSADSSWVDQAMVGDLIFIGCGLDRAETDIWLLLHERQRQFARIPHDERPRTLFLHPKEGFPPHVMTSPAGITPVFTGNHDESWELVLGKWWS